MADFTPDEMAGFEREAIRPYLELSTFFKRETWSSARTNCYLKQQSTTKGDKTHGLMVLEFRVGVVGIKAELWESDAYDGGIDLVNDWEIGSAIFPNGVNEAILGDLLTYYSEASNAMIATEEFVPALHAMEALFQKYVKKHETAFPEPQEEAAKLAVSAMLGS